MTAGTWQQFLREDAKSTRNSFAAWWSETFCKSQQFSGFSKSAKTQVEQLLNATLPNPPNPHSLLPETVSIIKTWQAIPLVQDDENPSPEYTRAIVRLVRDFLVSSEYPFYATYGGFKVKKTNLAAARSWLLKNHDGTIGKYESLAQPWGYKDIKWDPVEPTTRIVYPDNRPLPPSKFQSLYFDIESLRISKHTFDALCQGIYQSVPLKMIEGSEEQPIEIEDSDNDAEGGVKIKSDDGVSKNDADNSDISEDESVTTPPLEEIPWYDPLIHDERGRIIQ